MKPLRLVCSYAFAVTVVEAFLAPRRVWRGAECPSLVLVGAAENRDTAEEWKGFNPFDPSSMKSAASSTTKTTTVSTNQISLRRTQMQEIMSNLLNVVGDEQATVALLQDASDFLLEPLEDDEAVLELDSIYKPNMSREERYQTYRKAMQERIQGARNSDVRSVLQKLSDFVLAKE